ncbi:MAG: hypothetical protein QW561_03070 [Candidatus Aenigmatarchaeota archaeon]
MIEDLPDKQIEDYTAEDISLLLQAERRYAQQMSYSAYRRAKIWYTLKKIKAHLKMGYQFWYEFVYAETCYSLSYVDFWVAIYEKYGKLLNTPTAVGVPFSRLREGLKLIKTDEDAEDVLHHLQYPEPAWKDFLRSRLGKVPFDECEHPDVEVLERCKICGKFLGRKGGKDD